MRKFNITVNGKSYEVEVDEITESSSSTYQAPAAPASAPKAAPAPAPKAAPAPEKAAPAKKTPAIVSGGETVTSPMPGTVLDVKIKEGDTVKKDDVLFILEAMKMQNEIRASKGGTVAQIVVSKGTSVNTGDTLAVLK
ncbi:biotin/lipoyl-binding protein [Clostridium sp. WLY-B-L2]|uniref:Biotin/lipoyl-binding protein n=1 Tax=Clostridium aromativorans TaxID=2836848 RepID=A0ABS8N0H9_9CLOT|nr:biotin/lipoyl-containing protein [Clostridium aromativorans]MCC9293302.1 biotin/lipoyl-binding protein [Clostridium aromativorans]CAB1251904.1 Glutaconyl-CoA decarboxylase subunit gamma [Clostridiaceae bacterium BL-3]